MSLDLSETLSSSLRHSSQSMRETNIAADAASALDGTVAETLPMHNLRQVGVGAERPRFLQRRSPEYIFYALALFLAVLYLGFYDIWRVSTQHLEELKPNLREPWFMFRWLGSRGVDVTDLQWYNFTIALPVGGSFIGFFIFLSRRLRRGPARVLFSSVVHPVEKHTHLDPDREVAVPVEQTDLHPDLDHLASSRSLRSVLALQVVFGLILSIGICGPGFLFGVVIMLMNYFGVARMYPAAPFTVCMVVMWVGNVGILFLNSYAEGYRFSWFGLGVLDTLWTPIIPWIAQYNLSVLRIVAFNTDRWEAISSGEENKQKSIYKHERSCINCAVVRDRNRTAVGIPSEALRCYKCRTECPRAVAEYNLLSYMGYLLYPPLLFAGPMISFNAFISYLHHPTRAQTKKEVLRYGLRFIGSAVFLAAMMHFNYITAILFTKPQSAPPSPTATAFTTVAGIDDPSATPAVRLVSVLDQLYFSRKAVILFLALTFLWMKFNVFWKFFRLCALLDGVDPPEDMPRCFANTVNIQGFWRDWHASFNLWIVRYMYIPMGGARTKFFSIFPIFFFIAIWHDIELRLLYWAMFMCVCLIPEIVVTRVVASRSGYIARLKRHWLLWRYVRALGSELGMFVLIVINLIGFSIGTTEARSSITEMFRATTPIFRVMCPFFFFCAANIAIQDRDEEAYNKNTLKKKYNLQ